MKIEKLQELKNRGITHIASVVAKCFKTTYYNVVSIDRLISNNGKWIGAPIQCHTFKKGGYKNIKVGVSKVDWRTTELKQIVESKF